MSQGFALALLVLPVAGEEIDALENAEVLAHGARHFRGLRRGHGQAAPGGAQLLEQRQRAGVDRAFQDNPPSL